MVSVDSGGVKGLRGWASRKDVLRRDKSRFEVIWLLESVGILLKDIYWKLPECYRLRGILQGFNTHPEGESSDPKPLERRLSWELLRSVAFLAFLGCQAKSLEELTASC